MPTGGVLVQSLFSLISTGTEMMKLAEAKMSMVGKARVRPDQVRKVLDAVSQQGAVATYKKVMSKLDSYTPLGYSLCGVVTQVGQGAEEFKVGQRLQNGSSSAITYVTGGKWRYPKETLDVAAGGRSARLDNFRKATVWSGRRQSTMRSQGAQDKGQRAELTQFVEAVLTGAPMPIPVESLVAITKATIAVGESLLSGRLERM